MALTEKEKYDRRIGRFIESLLKIDGRLAVDGRHAKSKAINEVAKHFQRLVRLLQADRNGDVWCILCEAKRPHNHKGIDAGHYYPRGKHSRTIFWDMNCHPCCVRCNHHSSGNLRAYSEWMKHTYPDDLLDCLEEASKKPKKWEYHELAELKARYLDQIKFELKRIEAGKPPENPQRTLVDFKEAAK